MSSKNASKSAYRGRIFDQLIRKCFVPSVESFGSVDVPPGAAGGAVHRGPGDDHDLLVCSQSDDVTEHSNSLLVRQVHPLCDADRSRTRRDGLRELG